MMGLGDGIAFASLCLAFLGVFYKLTSYKKDQRSKVCSEHSGLVATIGALSEDIKEMKRDIKELLRRD